MSARPSGFGPRIQVSRSALSFRVSVMGPPGWFIGPAAAIAALSILGLQFALFASSGGLIIAAAVALGFGAGLAALIDPKRQGRNALFVAFAILVSLTAYLGLLASFRPPPGTSYGGPNVFPPELT